MTVRPAARQYAHALFDVAQKMGQVERIGREIATFSAIVAAHDDLGRVFGNPAISAPKKKAVVQAVVRASGELSGEVERLLMLLADRDRLALVGEIAEGYSARAMDAGRVVQAEITSAVALDEPTKAGLVRALSRSMDREVRVTERVDPAIIGGLVAKVGSIVFDGSVTRQIERMREKLLADV